MAMRERLFTSSLIDLTRGDTSTHGVAKRPGNTTGIPRSWNKKYESRATVSGQFSKAEDKKLMQCIQDYCSDHSLSIDDVSAYLSMEDRWREQIASRDMGIKGMWIVVAESFPQRNVQSVFRRGERLLVHHTGGVKTWTSSDIQELTNMVQAMGRKWVKIGHALKRHPTACRDKYSDVLAGKTADELTGGRFSPEEIKRLVYLVKKYADKARRRKEKKKDEEEGDSGVSSAAAAAAADNNDMFPTSGIPWSRIARKMNRTVSAIMHKWYFDIHRQVSGFGREEWGDPEDDALLQAIVDTDAEDVDEVPWNALPLRTTAATAKQRWLQLTKTIARSHMMSFEQIVETLDKRMRARVVSGGDGGDDDVIKQNSDGTHNFAHGRWWPSAGGDSSRATPKLSVHRVVEKRTKKINSRGSKIAEQESDDSISESDDRESVRKSREMPGLKRVREKGGEEEEGEEEEEEESESSAEERGGGGESNTMTNKVKRMVKLKVKLEEDAAAAAVREAEALEASEKARVKAVRKQEKLDRKAHRKEIRETREKRRKLRADQQ